MHGLGNAVCHWQGQPRPLHQGAKVADLAHGQHPWRQAPGHQAFRLGEARAQFVQRPAARQNGDAQPVGAQRAAALHQLTDRVVGPVQRQGMDHKIVRPGVQRQHIIIWHDPGISRKIGPDLRKSRHHGGRRKGSVNLGQSFLNIVAGEAVQEQRPGMAGQTLRPRAVAGKGLAVGEGWRRGHCAGP